MIANQTQQAAVERIAWLALVAARGETITYSAGSLSVEMVAVKTRPTTGQVPTSENVIVEARAWDWLIDPAELVNADLEPVEPRRGHKITTDDGTEYKLLPGSSGESVWRWSSAAHTWRRVHTEET